MICVVRLRPSITQRERERLVEALAKMGFKATPVEGRSDRLALKCDGTPNIEPVADLWGVERVISTDGAIDLQGRRHFLEVALPKLMLWLGILTALIFISGWFGRGLGEVPQPHGVPENLKPEWYLLAPHAIVSLLPNALDFLTPLLLAGLLAIALVWPFIEISPETEPRKRPLAIAVGLGVVGLWALLTLYGWLGI